MSPRDLVYLGHMLDMAKKAVGKTQSLSRGAYDADENLRLALIHLIQVIGEAGRQVSREFSDRHPEIPWADIIGMRHKVVHDYLGVDEDIVWQVVTEDLPKLCTMANVGSPNGDLVAPMREGSVGTSVKSVSSGLQSVASGEK